MSLFVLPCGVLWASGACGSALGYHRRLPCFPWSDPGSRFSVELGLRPCSLRMQLEGLAGVSCLSPPWRDAGSVQSPASLLHQVEGISQGSFPYQRSYSPGTRPVTLGATSTGPRWCLLIGAVQDQVQFGCFVLPLGVSQASFGLLSREGFPPGRPGSPSGPPWGLDASGPCGGPWAISAFSLS
jgi:hypothetical protein